MTLANARWHAIGSMLVWFSAGLGCSSERAQLAGDSADYREADRAADDVFGQIVAEENQAQFAKRVQAGFDASPLRYMDVVLSNVNDGDYAIGGRVYRNILASAKHSPQIEKNLQAFARRHATIKEVFNKFGAPVDTRITPQDLRTYFRFTADFLANGGFTGKLDYVLGRYPFKDLLGIMRTGVFITQLPRVAKKNGGKFFALNLADDDDGDDFDDAGVGAAGATAGAVTAEVTGRTSMGGRDPVQCRASDGSAMEYTGDEEINNRPIAGVDGTTLGTTSDGQSTSVCGKCAMVGDTEFIVVDRIWENDGANGMRYNDKSQADRKGSSIGNGYAQIDISKKKFYEKFGGNNASASFRIKDCGK